MAAIGVDTGDLRALVKRLRGDGSKQLIKDLRDALKAAAEPAADDAERRVQAMRRTGRTHATPSLVGRVATKVKVQVRTGTGRSTGVNVVAPLGGYPRGFDMAPRRLNRVGGWRHPVFGRNVWVTQVGAPGWFDDAIRAAGPGAEQRVQQVLTDLAERLSRG